jgi:tetratricopeptide (TPR) repeat protein
MRPFLKSLFFFLIIATSYGRSVSQGNESANSLIKAGESLAHSSPDKALPLFEKAMRISEQKKDWEVYLNAINSLAALQLDGHGDLQDHVFDLVIAATTTVKHTPKMEGVAQLHFNAGMLYNELTNEIDPTLYHFETARKIWQSLYGESNEKVANCYHRSADIYKYKKSDFTEAEIAYEKALSIREQIGLNDLPLLFRTYYSLAQTNRSQGDFEKALSYATQTLTIAKTLNNAVYQEMTHGVLASIYRDMDDSDQAKYHYKTAIQLNQTTRQTGTLGWYYQGLGETFKNDAQYTEAIKNLSKAHSLYVKEQARPSLVVYLSILMADTNSLMGADDNIFKMKSELSQMFSSLGLNQSRQESQVFVITGNHYYRKKNYDSALHYYQKALMSSVKNFKPRTISDNPTEKMIGYQYYVSGILTKKASVLTQKFLAEGNASHC